MVVFVQLTLSQESTCWIKAWFFLEQLYRDKSLVWISRQKQQKLNNLFLHLCATAFRMDTPLKLQEILKEEAIFIFYRIATNFMSPIIDSVFRLAIRKKMVLDQGCQRSLILENIVRKLQFLCWDLRRFEFSSSVTWSQMTERLWFECCHFESCSALKENFPGAGVKFQKWYQIWHLWFRAMQQQQNSF